MNEAIPDGKGKVSQVAREMEELNTQLEILEKTIAGLEDRLRPILMNVPTVEGKSPDDPVRELVPLALEIYERRHHLQVSINKVNSLHGRIEL
jgi:hypothetical protein